MISLPVKSQSFQHRRIIPLIIKNYIPTDSINVILQDRAIIITRRPFMSSQARLGYIFKESGDLEYCRNDTPDSLICNS